MQPPMLDPLIPLPPFSRGALAGTVASVGRDRSGYLHMLGIWKIMGWQMT
jgi:hypothetical protein